MTSTQWLALLLLFGPFIVCGLFFLLIEYRALTASRSNHEH